MTKKEPISAAAGDGMKEALIHELGYFAELFGEKAREAAEASKEQDEKGREDISAPLRARAMAFLDAEKAIKEEIGRLSR